MNFQKVDNFIQKINYSPQKQDEIDLYKYDTIILDADETMWEIKDPIGDGLSAKNLVPPFKKDPTNQNVLFDSQDNVVTLKKGLITTLNQLKMKGKDLYIVSYALKENVEYEEQPIVLLLDALGILKLFEEIILEKDDPKSESIKKIDDGNAAFIDDRDNNLIDVSLNTNVDTIDSKDHQDIFSCWYKKVVLADMENKEQYEDIEKRIQEDLRLAKQDIFTHRDDNGDLIFRINVNNGEIVQIDREFRRTHPKYYVGMRIPKIILEKVQEAHHKNFIHFQRRLQTLEKEYGHTDLEITTDSVDQILNDDVKIKNFIMSSRAITQDNQVNEDKLQEFLDHLEILPKFVAGTLQTLKFFSEGGTYSKIEAETIAEQIANFDVFGSFDGEEKFRIDNGIDFIPSEKQTQLINEQEYVSKKVSFIDQENQNNNEIVKEMKNQVQKMNYWINNGMYIYDNALTKQLSEPFKQKFGFYTEQCALVESVKDKVFYKMQKIAGDLLK